MDDSWMISYKQATPDVLHGICTGISVVSLHTEQIMGKVWLLSWLGRWVRGGLFESSSQVELFTDINRSAGITV